MAGPYTGLLVDWCRAERTTKMQRELILDPLCRYWAIADLETAVRRGLPVVFVLMNNGTLGFEYQEWVLRPGARLYVHGEVSDASGRVAFAKPSQGRYMISTRSEEQIVGAVPKEQIVKVLERHIS